MGYMRHHAIVVTSWDEQRLAAAHAKAVEVFHDSQRWGLCVVAGFGFVSPIMRTPVNSYGSFFVAPDGSKEGWDTSDAGDAARDALVEWLRPHAGYVDWVEVQFGDEELETKVSRDSDEEKRACATADEWEEFRECKYGNPSARV